MRSFLHHYLWILVSLFMAAFFQGCTCCAYLNHMFNAERAFEEAAELRTARTDSIPGDSSFPSMDERKKYDRVIEKGSRVLERFPKNKKRTAEAVFMMGESFRHKQEWNKAITKYDEFERYFSDHDSMPVIQYQRAYCLYRNGEYNISRFALEPVLNAGKAHPYYYEGQNLLSLLEEKSDLPNEAIAALENMLADTLGSPYMRAKIHFRLAGLYFKIENWAKSREHYLAKEIKELTIREKMTASIQAAECLGNQKEYLKAAEEYKKLMVEKDYQESLPEFIVRYGELLKLGEKMTEARAAFRKAIQDYPRTVYTARSYFHLGDDEQVRRRAYEQALVYYDSSFVSKPNSTWGQDSRERRDALRRMLALNNANEKIKSDTAEVVQKRFFDSEFQIAELFLFKLSEVDSAIQRLDAIIEKSDDSTRVLRASYARAFIYDEFKNDPNQAETLYKEIIEKYPSTEYAKQAQVNLGMRVSIKTEEDHAYERFLKAESLWFAAESIPLEQIAQVDSAYRQAFVAYDSVYLVYPKTQSGIQALFMKGIFYQMYPNTIDSAVYVFKELRSKFGQTPWGIEADRRLQTRVTITDDELKRLRSRIQQNEEHIERLSKQYYESLQPKKVADPTQEVKTKEEEILENTYNSMYDFE